MTLPASHTKFTYEDYLLFPDDGQRHELIDGDHYVTPAPKTKHQRISSNLQRILSNHVHHQNFGKIFSAPTDVVLADLDVVQPDLLYISAGKAALITEANIQGAPDLVIEILSETTRKTDELIKRKLYERYHIKEYWIVDPVLDTVKMYRLTDQAFTRTDELSHESHDTLTTPLLPDLHIPPAAMFE